MKNFILITCIAVLVSCSVKKPNAAVYHSEKLCNGIQNLSGHIDGSAEVKGYFLGNSGQAALTYEVDSLVTEGTAFPYLKAAVADIVKNEEKISLVQANKRLEEKFLSNPRKLNPVCPIKRKTGARPDVSIEYYYYPEYALLTASISKIKYTPEYAAGYLILAKLDSIGQVKILKTTTWQE